MTRRRSVLIAGLIVTAAMLGGAAWYRATLPSYDLTLQLSGVGAETTITRDRHAVPHIQAATLNDAVFALGFAHAQDRMWQMDWNRRLARGELAAVVGPKALPSDRLARLLRVSELADAGFDLLSPITKDALRSYAAGVNAWMARAPALPPEFATLRYRPAPWKPSDSLALLRGMAAQMSHNVRQEILIAELARKLGADDLQILFPRLGKEAALIPELRDDGAALKQAANALSHLPPASASNVWAVAGASGRGGVLANDPHLDLGAPALWYLARVESPDLRIAGGTIPGFPFFLLGHNASFAWGLTSSGTDLQDLFVEKAAPGEAGRYLTPEGSAAFVQRQATIEIAGAEPEILRWRESRHGPLLSDVGERASRLAATDIALALRYAGTTESDSTAEAILQLNLSADWDAVRQAARLWTVPAQNLVVANAKGEIGQIVLGSVPIRKGRTGRAPRVGWSGEDDWAGFAQGSASIPDPSARVVIEANHTPVGDQPRYVGDPVEEDFRAQRIKALLNAPAADPVGQSQAVQLDVFAADAASLRPLLLQTPAATATSAKALQLIREWDLSMSAGRPEPLIYAEWISHIERLLLKRRLGDIFPNAKLPFAALLRLLQDGRWCGGEAGCADLLQRALEAAIARLRSAHGDDMTTWRWGAEHRARLSHIIWSHIPGLSRWADLSLPIGGGRHTVNRADYDAHGPERFAATTGASYRAVYDLADFSRSRFMIATGQSGHPGSPYYGDLTRAWASGDFLVLNGKAIQERPPITRLLPP